MEVRHFINSIEIVCYLIFTRIVALLVFHLYKPKNCLQHFVGKIKKGKLFLKTLQQ